MSGESSKKYRVVVVLKSGVTIKIEISEHGMDYLSRSLSQGKNTSIHPTPNDGEVFLFRQEDISMVVSEDMFLGNNYGV